MSDSPEETALNRQWAQSRSEGAAPRVRTALATCDRAAAADSGIHGDFGLCLERTHCPCGLASSGSMVWQVPRYTLLKALSLKFLKFLNLNPKEPAGSVFFGRN